MYLKNQWRKNYLNIHLISLAVAAYFLGSIPFGLLASKYAQVDIRSQGSKNIGATNVYRVMGWKWGLLVFVLDALKGYIPTVIAHTITEQAIYIITVGMLAIIGHSLSVFVRFKGGKGAATGLGVLAAIAPDVWMIVVIIAVTTIAVFKYVAPVTIGCSILIPILLYVYNYSNAYVGVVSVISLLVIIRHKDNIKRLFSGNENKL
jgi:glycerol-3-phosphate acyltransferase PlsY